MPRTCQQVTCLNCNKEFDKALKEIRRSPNHFCTRSCSASWHNRNCPTAIRRSKFEVRVERLMNERFSTLPVAYNDRKTVGLELDMYVPSLKLAFEFNGIAHYKPIFGQAALDKTQLTDKRKIELCKEKNIKLVIIDISNMPRFKYYKFLEHFAHITSNIADSGIYE